MSRLHFPLIIYFATYREPSPFCTYEALGTSMSKATNLSRSERVMTLAAFVSIVLFTHAYYFNAFRATYKDHLVYYTGTQRGTLILIRTLYAHINHKAPSKK